MSSYDKQVFSFDLKTALHRAPEAHGVYTFFNQDMEIVYFGKAEKQTLRDRLMQHIKSSDQCLASACYFTFEVVKNPGKELLKKLKSFEAAHGQMPQCNEILEKDAVNVSRMLAIDGVLTSAFLN